MLVFRLVMPSRLITTQVTGSNYNNPIHPYMANNNLSIRLLPDGFSFSIGEAPWQDTHIPAGSDFTTRLEDALLSQQELLQEFDSVSCEVFTTRICLSPEAIVSDDDALSMYNLSLSAISGKEEEHILHEVVSGARFSFGISHRLYLFLLRTFQQISFHHPLALLHARHPQGTMVASVAHGQLYILVYNKEGQLLLANAYATSERENMAYFIMNTWRECNLDILYDSLVLNDENDDLQTILSPFIKVISSI